MGRARKRVCGEVGVEGRRMEVARLLMERKNYREILVALTQLPPGRRPKSVSLGTVSRDVAALRAEWAALRGQVYEELVGEEIARLNRLERVWWPLALEAKSDATDRVLAIQRQRASLLGLGGNKGAMRVTAEATGAAGGAGALEASTGPVEKVKIRVELVDDWRDA